MLVPHRDNFYRLPGAGQQTVGVVVVVGGGVTKLQICSLSTGKQPKQFADEAEALLKQFAGGTAPYRWRRWHHRWCQVTELQNKLLLAAKAVWG